MSFYLTLYPSQYLTFALYDIFFQNVYNITLFRLSFGMLVPVKYLFTWIATQMLYIVPAGIGQAQNWLQHAKIRKFVLSIQERVKLKVKRCVMKVQKLLKLYFYDMD